MKVVRFLQEKRYRKLARSAWPKYDWSQVDPEWGRIYTLGHRKPNDGTLWDMRFHSRDRTAYCGWDVDRNRFIVEGRKRRWPTSCPFHHRIGWRRFVYGDFPWTE